MKVGGEFYSATIGEKYPVVYSGDLSQEALPDPGAGDDHGALPLRLCHDRVPAALEIAGDR